MSAAAVLWLCFLLHGKGGGVGIGPFSDCTSVAWCMMAVCWCSYAAVLLAQLDLLLLER